MSDIARKYLPIYVTEDIRGLCSPATRDQQRVILLDRISNEHLMSTLLCWETIHQHSNEFESYIRLLSGLLNMIIPGSEFAIRGDCERIEQRLKSKCYSVLREFHSLMGEKKKQEFASQKSFKMNVFADEVFSVDDLFDDFSQSVNENWKKK